MLKSLCARLRQGHHTFPFPDGEAPVLSDRFCAGPMVNSALCVGCGACAGVCPTDAICMPDKIGVDLGRCLNCAACAVACPHGAITMSRDYRLGVRHREELVREGTGSLVLAEPLEGSIRRMFGRSLKLRQVSAGGCNACEADVNVLSTIGWDLGRFGVQMVASPRHADGLLVTGPVTKNMRVALIKTYEAVPSPKIVIAVGSCAISGGIYRGHPQQSDGVGGLLPVDLFVPGCPPHPLTILDGILRLLGRILPSVDNKALEEKT